MKQTVVPNRNVIFASILYGLAISESMEHDSNVVVALGVHSGTTKSIQIAGPNLHSVREGFHNRKLVSENISFYLPYIQGLQTILEDRSRTHSPGLDFDTVFKNTNTSYNPDEQGRPSGRSGRT